MVRPVKYPLVLVSVILWIGFLAAISFMEAWLKFQAEGVTLAIGLSVGKLIFFALNKVELVFSVIILVHLIYYRRQIFEHSIWLKTPMFMLLIQTFYLLPKLDERANIILSGQAVPASNLHLYYVFFEVIKLVSLALYTKKTFQKSPKQ